MMHKRNLLVANYGKHQSFFLFPPSPNVGNPRSATELLSNKNAFQWDAYRLLVDRISRSIRQGGVCLWTQGADTPPNRQTLPCPVHAGIHTAFRGQTDTCENITFAIFVSGR